VSHLLVVSGLVLEAGGNENEAMAGLLHDAVEDGGGEKRLADIHARFGETVAGIVKECSDSVVEDPQKKALPKERKRLHLEHLRHDVSESALLVTAADKLHNARCILRDYRDLGEKLWERFNVGRADTLEYYESLATILEARGVQLSGELRHTVNELQTLAKAAQNGATDDLNVIMMQAGRVLDDPSVELLGRLRDERVLDDADWARICVWLREALEFLARPNETATRDKDGRLVINPDADPRNANWIRISAASRQAGHTLPMWAAMWLWRLGHERGAAFWHRIGSAARHLGYPKVESKNEQ
jgi:hypothetical protein